MKMGRSRGASTSSLYLAIAFLSSSSRAFCSASSNMSGMLGSVPANLVPGWAGRGVSSISFLMAGHRFSSTKRFQSSSASVGSRFWFVSRQ
ncbi:hypothetical protein F4821DRAFT_224400 [Hypoxylon rubiginosum]|uniref:Uncharacterized protein n=1 Tax=Hypoxylon rubiginosum TaxID=110542 RepID=A0ACC0DJ11_9PEZI|nr:hypothetical protein F4821DRAFT_224400 [Hypoxylon rubiginosum]